MPANLPPQYYEAEKSLRAARSVPEKIEALETMLAIMPKHKGTDKLRAELRARIARLTEEAERARGGGRRGSFFYIRKEGAGQAALVGLPNVGKSQLVAALTEARPEVADYPFTTRFPVVGMMPFENVQIQLVDLPAISDVDARPWLPEVLKRADVLVLVIEQGKDCMSQVQELFARLEQMRIQVAGAKAPGQPEDMLVTKKALLLANKADLSPESYLELESCYGKDLPVLSVSARDGTGLEEFKRKLFEALKVIRVYTRAPGGRAEMTRPVVLRRGSTVEDAAASIHKDFKAKLRYAQIWGSGKFEGQMVKKDYVLQDGDVIEFHV